jgi:hypothetical protein
MLMVNSRVTSPIIRVVIPRWLQPSFARSSRSDGRRDPMFGGTWVSSGPITSAMPSNHSFHLGQASASFLENCASCSWVRAASSS